jgi:hypothetical protein
MPVVSLRWDVWGKYLKAAVGAAVLVAVGHYVFRTWGKLHAEGRTVRVEAAWVAAAVGLYLAGLCGFGVFFGRVLNASPTPIPSGRRCGPT